MIGRNEIIIDASSFIKGMSSGADITDGGFSSETDAVNLIASPGVLYAPASPVDSDTDTRLTGNVIASSPDMALLSVDNRLLVTDDDKYYRYNGTKIIAAAYTGGTGSTNVAGFTDIITYRGEAYVSSKERIKLWQNDNTISDLGSFTTQTVPHPMFVYENNFYAADGNLLLQATALNTMPTVILTLDANQIIMALGIDPGTGQMLISTITTVDTSGTIPTLSKLLWYDGNSQKVVRSTIVEDTIFGFHSNSGVTYVGYGKSLGYINGSGISFIRKLNNVTNVPAELPYKHHFASIGNHLYVLNGLQILAFGEVIRGKKVLYPCYKNNINSNKPTCIFNAGYNSGTSKLGICFATTKFYTFDTTGVSTTNTMLLHSLRYTFPRPVTITSLYIEYADAVTNGDNNRNLYYKTQAQSSFAILGIIQGTNLKNESGSSVYEINNIGGIADNKVKWFQLRYNVDTTNFGVRRIIAYYNPAE